MKEKEIIQKIIEVIGEIENAKVISAFDFSDEREANMIVVGIDKVEQMNVGLPDYKYALNITIDTFIEDDPNGELFHDTLSDVESKISGYILHEQPLSSAFGEIPIVGWLNSDITISITTDSNRAIFSSELVASF